jgi:predicted CXXCH cytochrome family protein
MPHPDGWAGRTHGARATADRTLCRNCHPSAFCLDCHKKAKPSTPVHKEGCSICHDAKTWAFLGQSRSCWKCHKDHLSDKAPAKHRECIGCHVPHTWKPAATPGLCANCHADQAAKAKTVPEMQDCTICHNPHTWKFGGTDLCLGCHDDVAKDIGKFKLMPDCTTCHPTHQWKIKDIGGTCGACHQNMPGHEGDAFAKCTECHAPHRWKP